MLNLDENGIALRWVNVVYYNGLMQLILKGTL